ncbi:MAG: DNA polymerase III subunit alpha [Alphaproteobacteria bacterium]|nr:DNA polymerase III subunit alpha [Alphaproteobacteria bacterium]
MAHANFVHLRVHSAYSLSEGAIKLKDLVGLCKAEKMPAVAVTDTGNVFGALEFCTAAVEYGVQPILGCQIHVRYEAEGMRGLRTAEPAQLVLLVQDRQGYANLTRLMSEAFLETPPGETPQVSLARVVELSAGLIVLSGGVRGPIARAMLEGRAPAAEATAEQLRAGFPGRFYIELQRHGVPEEERVEEALVALAYRLDLPLVATNEPFFTKADVHEAHDALLCIAEGAYVAQDDRRKLTAEHRFKSAAEMRALFADLPEACDNTLVIARRCGFLLEPVKKPTLPTPPKARATGVEQTFRQTATAGLEERLRRQVWTEGMDGATREKVAEPYRARLKYELDMIVRMGFDGYFLIVADFIQWAKAHGIPVGPGRGSGAGSLVAWALTITDLDPLRFGLLFERFLNPERVSMPDFDIDFCQDRRDEVIRYVRDEYGADRVAQIITFGKLQARAVVRDVGRVLGMPYGQVDRISKLIPNNPANPIGLQQAIDGEPQLQQMIKEDPAVARLTDIALKLEGLYRHASTHAAGVVIGDKPLVEMVPLYRDPRAPLPATQFNMKWVEQAGLVKFDFLGLKTLTVLQRAVDLVAKARNRQIELMTVPLDDAKTYAMLTKGETVGVFQLESAGMRDAVRGMRPDRLEDLIALVALYRPGPMENIPRYNACKHGKEKPDYLHPTLEPILKETFGVMVYQEQVMQIAQVMCGYSLGQADLLRRAMGKKDKSQMEALRKSFVEGAVRNNVDEAKASHIFDLVDKFAGYAFNKSHAAAYALVSYHTAWLKANYPVEFMAASMSFDLANTDKLAVFRQEIDRLGIALLPPDINRSEAAFSVEFVKDDPKGAVRYALAAIKGVGPAAMEGLVAERRANGPFKDLSDFARRVDPKQVNKRLLEQLVKAGALDCLEPNRARAFATIELVLAEANAEAEARVSNQSNLFGGAAQRPKLRPPALTDWPLAQRLQSEFESIGFYLSAHPLDAYNVALKRLGVVRAVDLPQRLRAGGAARVKLAGSVIGKQERTSAKGNRFAFVQCSDASGVFEVTLFSEVLAVARDLLASGKPLLISADARLEEDAVKLLAQSIQPLDVAAASAAAGLRIALNDAAALPGLRDIIAGEKRGRGRIVLDLVLGPEDSAEIQLPGAYMISPDTRARVAGLAGVTEVQEI